MQNRLLILIAVMAFSAFVSIFLGSKVSPDKKLFSMLWAKYVTTLVIIGAVVIPVVSGPMVFLAFITILTIVSHYEMICLAVPDVSIGVKLAALILSAVMVWAGFLEGEKAVLDMVVLGMALLLCLSCFQKQGIAQWQKNGQLALTMAYPVVFWVFFILLYKLPLGPELVLYFYCVTEMNNSFAQLAGSLFGKKKIFPVISPNKTWEGVLGGMAAALAAGWSMLFFVFEFPWIIGIGSIFLIIIGATAGDIVASKIKRIFKVKDFGNILPNHGGVIDIFDSIIFTAPFFYWYAVYLFR